MKPYSTEIETGRVRFYGTSWRHERIRTPRSRAQKLYVRFGGIPFLPMRIVHYATPAFYYSDLMRHRRKLDLDQGLSKIRHGLCRLRECPPASTGSA